MKIARRRIEKSGLQDQKKAVQELLNGLFGYEVEIRHESTGLPYIIGPQGERVNVSISHTMSYVFVAVSPQFRVGVDVEAAGRNFKAVRRVMRASEQKQGSEEQNLRMGVIWCAKEAIYKMMGVYNVDFGKELEVQVDKVIEDGQVHRLVVSYIRATGNQEETYSEGRGAVQKYEANYQIFDNHIFVWLSENMLSD